MLTQTLDGLMGLFRDRVLPFDIDAARRYSELAVTAKVAGRGFPTPDGYIAAIVNIGSGLDMQDLYKNCQSEI